MGPGAYPIANYSTLSGAPTFNLVNKAGSIGSSVMSIDESVPGVISLDVLSAGASSTLSWAGNVNTGGSYLWDIANTLNWTSSGSASAYNEGNRVVFSNTASNFVVTVNQQVNPTSVTFSSSSHGYTLTGNGGIEGTTFPVAINGGGSVTFNNNNAYTSATNVTNGSTLIVNGSLPNSNVFVTGAYIGGNGQLAASPVSLTTSGASSLTPGSDLSVYGAANVVSGTFTIPASATLSGTGGINVSSGAQLVLSGIVDVNQVVNLNGALLSGSGTVNGGVNLTSGTLAPAGTLTLNGAVTNSGTSILGSGIISTNGAWTGSGAINVPSGSDLLLGGGATTAGVTLNVSGTLDGTNGGNVNGPVNVLGSGTATIIAGTSPDVTASGGTTNLAGATVNVATVSGSNAVVNVTAGSVPILNVGNSNLTSGVTVGPAATVGSTSLGVSGGLVTLENINTIPTAALSGGTTNWAGPDREHGHHFGQQHGRQHNLLQQSADSKRGQQQPDRRRHRGTLRDGRQHFSGRVRRPAEPEQHQHDPRRHAFRRHDQPERSQCDRGHRFGQQHRRQRDRRQRADPERHQQQPDRRRNDFFGRLGLQYGVDRLRRPGEPEQ